MWTEKEITIKRPLFVGEVYNGTIDLSDEDFDVRGVTGECQCLRAGQVIGAHNIIAYEYTVQPFPTHLEYKDSYKSFSLIVLATTKGRKQIKLNVTLKQDKNGISE